MAVTVASMAVAVSAEAPAEAGFMVAVDSTVGEVPTAVVLTAAVHMEVDTGNCPGFCN